MKRWISMLLVFSMIFTMLPVTAFASDEVAGGSCGENLTWTLDAQGVLTFSGEGEMADYSESSTPWQDYREQILEVIFQDHIASVSARAFDACTGLTKVTFHSDAPSFGEDCFCGVSAAVYYPAENTTWEEAVQQNYGGNLVWICDDFGASGQIEEINTELLPESDFSNLSEETIEISDVPLDENIESTENAEEAQVEEVETEENEKIDFNDLTTSVESNVVYASYSGAKLLPTLTGDQAVDTANIAKSQEGYTFSGGTIYGEWWMNTMHPGNTYFITAPWCAMFACWCANQAGVDLKKVCNSNGAGTGYLFDYLKVNGTYDTNGTTTPEPGDFLFFKSSSGSIGHVAIVYSYNTSSKVITFYGGNQGGKVTKSTISWRIGAQWDEDLFVAGYGRPKYEDSHVKETFPSFGRIEITKSNVDVMSLPCSNGTDPESQSLETANEGDTYIALELILNTKDNYWYRVKSKKTGEDAYIYAGNTKWKEHFKDDTEIIVNKAPTLLYEGGGFYLDAEITATYNSLYSVASLVYSGTATSGEPVTGNQIAMSVPTHSYTIAQGTELDNATKFSTLPVGSYTYCIKATYISYYATSGTTKEAVEIWGDAYKKQFTVAAEEEKPVIYTITLNSNGGSDEESSFTVLKDNSLGTLPEPSFEGMSFEGWYTEPFGGGTQVTENTVPTGDMTLYAHYTYSTGIKLEFDPNGGWIPEAVYTETLDGINRDRLEKELIVYQDADRYWSNQYGKEVAVSATGKVIGYRGYDVAWDEAFFPDGGFVLSGQYHWDSDVGADVGSSAFIAKIKTLMDQGDVYVSVNYETGEVKVFTSYAGYLNETKRGQEWTTYGTLPIPVRDGYVFSGWDVDGSDVYYDKGFSGYQLRASWSEEDSLYPEETIEYNGHRYEVYDYITSWTKAKALCEDMGGHLVTITDANEQTAILGLMESGKRGYYLIGATNPEQDETWNWVTGETFSYNYWDSNEPSCDEAEFYAGIIAIENPPNKQVGDWIDTKNEYHPNVEYNNFYDQSNTGFICEYDTVCDHNYTYSIKQAPTTLATGILRYECSSCGQYTDSVLPALNKSDYSYSVSSTPGCTNTGIGTYTWVTDEGDVFSFDAELPATGHSYQSKVTVPTCTAQGYTTHTCSGCGDTYKDSYVNALGHAYTYKVNKNPTETATGTLTGTCSRCSGTTTVTLPKLNTTDYSYQVTKTATCTATGTARYTWKTTTYGSFYFDVTLAKAAHSYTSKVTAPTCTAQGYTTYTCTCGDTYKDDYVNALGHSYTYKVSKNPTEAATGTLTGTCSRCSGTATVTLPKLNTTDYTYQVTKAASCTATGTARYTWKTTTYGSYYFDVTLAKTAHSYTSKVTAPTCTEQGYTTHTCSGCGDNYKDSYVNATGHKWDSGKVTTAATCTKDGVKTYTCTSCSTTKTEAIAATGHSYSAAVTKPTCTEKGYTTHTCSCGDSYVDTYVDAAGHKWDNGVVTKEATEKETGIRTFTCTVCKETRTEEIPTLEHKHVYTAKVTPPTCTEQGYTTHTCSCGDSYVDSYVDAIGHKWDSGKVTTAATCTEDGVKTYTCANCSTTKTETIAAAGHKHEATVTAPTCTEKGYTTHTCSCGDIYVDTYVNALGHTFENGYCTRCGAKDPDYVETITGNCGDNLTWTLYDGTLTISGTGAMSTFDRDTQPWAAYKSDIRHVIVEDGVTSVSEEAFYKCTALETVVIADSVTAIGNWAFSYCASLTDIDTGDGIAQLGSYTFMQCTALRNVTLSNNLTIICDYAFRGCIALESIILPEMLTEIDIFAFAKCEQLVEVTLPKSLQTLNYGAFMGCTRLKKINVEEGNANYCSVEGVVYNAKMTILVAVPGGWEGAFIIPEGVLMIGERAFQLCNSLYEVSIPDTVSSIQSGAFMNCDGLTRIVIPASIDLIETSAFSSCDNLTEILFLGKAPAIRNSAFEGVIATVYYPVNKSGWTSDVMQQYGGTLTWIANDPCAEGHTYGSNVTAPTCTEQGYTTHSCSVCGNTYKDSYVDATGHKWDSGKVTTAATCTKDGVKTYTCTSCFTSKTETVAATGHKHEATVTAPTCTEKGYTTHTCSACGDSYVDTYVDPLGHDYQNGICSRCGAEDPDAGILDSGTVGSNLSWTLTKDGILTISGKGAMSLTSTTSPWKGNMNILSIVIEDGVTTVGSGAFCNLYNLKTVDLPDSITSIDKYAFQNCSSLQAISIPNSVTSIGLQAFEDCESITELIIPENVTSIGQGAFYKCVGLKTLEILGNVTTVESEIFKGCTGLETVVLADGFTTIGSSMFYGCTGLRNITLPDSVTCIIIDAFRGCSSLQSVIIPDSVTDIGINVFFDCTSLTDVKLPIGMTKIRMSMFQNCSRLSNIQIPESVTIIEDQAFYMCSGLREIIVPANITSLGKFAFGSCELTSITFEGNAPKFASSTFNGSTATAHYPGENETWTSDVMQNYGGTITWVPYGDVHEHTEVIDAAVEPTCTETGLTEGKHCSECGEILVAQEEIPALGHSYENGSCTVCGEADPNYSTAVKIASGWSGDLTWVLTDDGVLTFSGTGAMKNYGYKSEMPWYKYIDQITSVVINEGATRIGDYAFYGMTKLETIDIADTVTYIGDFSFKGSTALDGVVLPPNLSNLGTSAFYGCTGLTSIEIPASLYTVKPYAFKNCSSLAEVTFHEGNLMKLSDGSFYGTALTEVEFPKCLDIIDVYCFKNCFQLASITIPEGDLTQIREAVFYATAIPSITIPEGVTKVGPYAFKNCVNLNNVSLPTTLTSVGEASFYACTGLQGITIPDAVTSIGDYAFRKCAAMTEVNLGRDLIDIGLCAFYGCSGLTNLEILDKVTNIQSYAFKGCTGLTDVTLGSSVETLGESAFHTCTALKTLELPASLKTIGDYCFSGSYNLWQLTFNGNAPSIGSGAFKSMAATACYPANDSTWTSDVMQNYGGRITWKADD